MRRGAASRPGRLTPITPALLARQASERAYAPYSGFRVGAVLEDEGGRFHAGCNVECASLGLSLCAERTALGAALTLGARRFRRLWIYTPTRHPTPPCGACRELLYRISEDLQIILLCDGASPRRTSLRRLHPASKPPRRIDS